MAHFASLLWMIHAVLSFKLTRAASLMMVPEKAQLMVAEGSKLELQCIHQHKRGTTPESFLFMKNSDTLRELTSGSNLVDDIWTDTSTYTKEKATMVDSAKYQCVLQPSGTTSDITVYVFRLPILESVMLNESQAVLNLTCDLQGFPLSKYDVSWEKNNVTIKESDRYTQFGDVLLIDGPKRADMGEYKCIITFFPDSDRDRHIIRPGFVAVKAPPAIYPYPGNMKIVEKGDDHELVCTASGYPLPSVKWFKDGVKIRRRHKTDYGQHGGIDGAKLKLYSLEYEDEGNYSCVATNEISPYNATAVVKVQLLRRKPRSSASVTLRAEELLVIACLFLMSFGQFI